MTNNPHELATALKQSETKEAVRFWANELMIPWPHDSPDYVFLARGLHAIGQAIFPELWTRTEPQEWAAQGMPIRLTAKEGLAPPERMSLAVQTIVANAHAGQLRFASRPRELLAFSPLPWEVGDHYRRFFNCRVGSQDMSPAATKASDDFEIRDLKDLALWDSMRSSKFPAKRRSSAGHWIFLTRESLEGWLRSSAHERVGGRVTSSIKTDRPDAAVAYKKTAQFSPQKLLRWCSDLVETRRQEGTRPPLKEVVRMARKELGYIPREAIREAWRNCRPADWSRPGRPSKVKPAKQ